MNKDIIIYKKFSYLPLDLVNMILEYVNVITYRNGKYIDRIDKKDLRYNIIMKIKRPIKINDTQYYIGLREKKHKVTKISLTYIIEQEVIRIITYENHIGRNSLVYCNNYKNDVLF
jgi:hypothetical protein